MPKNEAAGPLTPDQMDKWIREEKKRRQPQPERRIDLPLPDNDPNRIPENDPDKKPEEKPGRRIIKINPDGTEE